MTRNTFTQRDRERRMAARMQPETADEIATHEYEMRKWDSTDRAPVRARKQRSDAETSLAIDNAQRNFV